MREISKRTAAFSTAIAGFALIGSACGHSGGPSPSVTVSTTVATSPLTAGMTATSAGPLTEMTGVNGAVFSISGPILDRYNSLNDTAKKDLGLPTGNQVTNPDGGIYQRSTAA